MFGFNWAPRGYALCQGQQQNIGSQQALYSLIGITFGGNGTSTFNLPDMRSRFPVCYGQGPGLSLYQLGAKSGAETSTLSIANMPIHNHPATYTPPSFQPIAYTQPSAATTINAFTAPTARQVSPANGILTGGQDTNTSATVTNYSTAGTAATLAAGAATTTLSGGGVSGGNMTSGGNVAVGNNGGSTPFSNLPPYIAMSYAIALVGLYPPRN